MIVFTGDTTRFDVVRLNDGVVLKPSQTANIRFLHAVSRTPCNRAFGLEPQLHLPSPDDAGFMAVALEEQALSGKDGDGQSRQVTTHARNYESCDPRIAATFLDSVRGAELVVGFELSPGQMKILDAAGIPFLYVTVHPYRCLHDLALLIGSNLPAVIDVLRPLALPSYDLELSLDTARAAAARHDIVPHWLPVGTVVVAAQVPGDASLIKDGQLHYLSDHIPELLAHTSDAPMAIILPHPYGPAEMTDERALLSRMTGMAMISRINPYVLLCDERVSGVISLSSSLSAEAAAFGKKGITLLRDPMTRPECAATLAVTGNAIRTTEFWSAIAAVLRRLPRATLPPRLPFGDLPLFRRALGWQWSLQELMDSKSLPRQPRIVNLRQLESDGAQFIREAWHLVFDDDPRDNTAWHVGDLEARGREPKIAEFLASAEAYGMPLVSAL